MHRPMTARQKGILIAIGLLAVLVYAALLLVLVHRFILTRHGSGLRIISPSDGFAVREGETLVVQAVATGQELVRAELWVDGVLAEAETDARRTDNRTWSASSRWMAQGQGQRQLCVKVHNVSGGVLSSPSIIVYVVPSEQIVFASDRGGDHDLYTMHAHGGEAVQLTSGPEEDREPSCSGTELVVFASTAVGGGRDIWLSRVGDHRRMNLTEALGGDYCPRWSPDNNTIAFVSDRYGSGQLFLMNPDGSDQFQLTRQDASVEQPSWAPDGSSLLFAAEQDGNWDIFEFSLGEGSISRLTDDPAEDWYPAWSPTGDQIAFVSDREGNHQVYVMQRDGTGLNKLTAFTSGAEQPRWSANGEWLVFVAYSGQGEGTGAREIYIMRRDGSSQIRLTNNEFDDTEPCWCQCNGR